MSKFDRLKFRLWDDIKNEMLDLQEQDINPYNISDIPQNNIMQCTGYKDKNGTLIYEGDIIRKCDVNALGWGRVRICKVYWHVEWGSWEILTTLGDGYMLTDFSSECYEIIGNIYQTPSLLENEDDDEDEDDEEG